MRVLLLVLLVPQSLHIPWVVMALTAALQRVAWH